LECHRHRSTSLTIQEAREISLRYAEDRCDLILLRDEREQFVFDELVQVVTLASSTPG